MTEVPCPECGSLQSFAPRSRREGNQVIVYVLCTMCRYTQLLYTTTNDIERLRRRISKMTGMQRTHFSPRRERQITELRNKVALLSERHGVNPLV